jgi:hypothetical protein
MKCFEEWWAENHDEWSYDVGATAKAAWEAALMTKTESVVEVPCSDGLSCPLLDECDAVSEAIGDKQILASALREIYNIRGEDKDIDRIVNEALYQACAT